MSTRAEYSLTDVLTPEELQTVEDPDDIREFPDAEVVEWDETSAVTTPGFSLASSMDRFQGSMTPDQRKLLEGFYGEFRENDEAIVFLDEDLRELLGDKAHARFPEDERAYPVALRSAAEAVDVIEEYDSMYAGDIADQFWRSIESNQAVVPALYDEEGVIDETAVSLIYADGVLGSDVNPTPEQMLRKGLEDPEEDLETEMKSVSENLESEGLYTETYPATDDEEAERYVSVVLPSDYDSVGWDRSGTSLVIEADGKSRLETLKESEEVLDAEENNGMYTLRIA